jgi:hypothetical protein
MKEVRLRDLRGESRVFRSVSFARGFAALKLYAAKSTFGVCLIGFEASQGWDHFRTEQSDRSHQVFLSDIADVELAENGVEHAFAGGGFDLFHNCFR